ncbi:3062_t:CDS:2 [Entrophospora sp. SA101]|nr:3062_t:CDS:2 [Entrophospora sp. SA101]
MKNYKKYDVMIRKGLLFDSINESYKSYRPDFPPNISTNDIVGMANQKSHDKPRGKVEASQINSLPDFIFSGKTLEGGARLCSKIL